MLAIGISGGADREELVRYTHGGSEVHMRTKRTLLRRSHRRVGAGRRGRRRNCEGRVRLGQDRLRAGGEQGGGPAVKAAGGGKALEVELQDDGAGVYEVEVRRENGSQIEVHLDAQFQSVGTAADDDTDRAPRRTARRTTRVRDGSPARSGLPIISSDLAARMCTCVFSSSRTAKMAWPSRPRPA